METILKGISIQGLVSVVPEKELDLISLSEIYGENEVRKIITTTGIRKVRIADERTTASDLCLFAGMELLKNLKIDKSEIDAIIFVSQTNDYILPQTSNVIHGKLGLGDNVYCLDIRLGCSGYVMGLFQAAMLLQSESCKKVLLLAGDTTSKMIHPKDKSLRMVFGDAGSATLVSKGNNEIGFIINNQGSGFTDLIVPAGGFRTPCTENTSLEQVDFDGNVRCENDLYMNGAGIFNFAINKVPPMIERLLEMSLWKKESIDYYLFHQANNFMVNYLRKKLKISPGQVPLGVENYGNTGPTTIPLLLGSFDAVSKERTIMCGFGVGLSWAGCYVNLSKTKLFSTIVYKN